MNLNSRFTPTLVFLFATCALAQNNATGTNSFDNATDPGLRTGPPGAGLPLTGLSVGQLAYFNGDAAPTFAEVEAVANGLGPRFNLDSCAGCHAFPASGGSSPRTGNPQVVRVSTMAPGNSVPSFLSMNGPIRVARMVKNPDGSRWCGLVQKAHEHRERHQVWRYGTARLFQFRQ